MSASTRVRPPVSGVVICFNEADRIARTLESLSFCDEIVVIDSCSTDGTAEVARRFTDRVIEQDFLGYVKQKNFALDQATHDWVVCLDSDEVLTPELVLTIRAAIERDPEFSGGFQLDRVTRFLGIWHDRGEWYPDWQLRVFRRSAGHWTGLDPHDRVEVPGAVIRLEGRFEHYNYRDLADHIQTIDKFSASLAQSMYDSGVRFRLLDLLVRPFTRFLKGYFLRQGFRLGLPGFLVSISTSYYVFMKYAKLWELELRRER
ncbi:MAG: glycosyltransferase family 2 protein [bacterium]|nr:glycosyltransferase family 2 protein [bacterium]